MLKAPQYFRYLQTTNDTAHKIRYFLGVIFPPNSFHPDYLIIVNNFIQPFFLME